MLRPSPDGAVILNIRSASLAHVAACLAGGEVNQNHCALSSSVQIRIDLASF
jgi:hypothetical protein